jgi:hypothetical protein
MAITARTPTVVESASTLTITGTLPADRQAGDLHIATFVFTTTTSVTGPAGWTALYTPAAQGTVQMAAYYAISPSSDPTASYSGTAGRATVIVEAWGGVDSTTPIDTSAVRTAGLGTSLVATGVTTATAGALLVSAYAADTSTRTTVAPSGMTQLATYSAASSGKCAALASEARPTAGATGTRTWAMSPAVSIDQIAYCVALRQAAKTTTGTLSAAVALSGGALKGKSGSLSGVAAAAGGVRLGITDQGAGLSATGSLSGSASVVSRNFTGQLLIEFTAGVWTDVTDRLNFSRGSLKITRGRKEPYGNVNPSVMSFNLYNPDGEFMTCNTSSPYYPNVVENKRVQWKVTKGGVTYTRFNGFIQSWEPDFPTGDLIGASVAVSATDALGIMAQRVMNSNITDRALNIARTESVTVEAYEAIGKTSGYIAAMKNCSTDAAKSSAGYLYATTDSTLEFGEDNDVSIGGVVKVPSAKSPSKTICYIRTSKQIIFHAKTFGKYPASFSAFASFGKASGYLVHVGCNSTGQLILINGSGVTVATLGTMPIGQWVRIKAECTDADPAKSNWTCAAQGGDFISASDIALDVREAISLFFPGMTGDADYPGASIGGVIAINTTSGLVVANSFSGSTNGTASTRIDDLTLAISDMPISVQKIGDLDFVTKTGVWGGKTALDVAQEIARTTKAMVYARPRDGMVQFIEYDSVFNSGNMATVNVDSDCTGVPKLTYGSENVPSRVEIEWPGGSETYINSTREASGVQRSISTKMVSNSRANARSAAAILLLSGIYPLRMSNINVDLTTGATDHTATFFNESGDITGLVPWSRLTMTVPASHFGIPAKLFYVVGWTEDYSPKGVFVNIDAFY